MVLSGGVRKAALTAHVVTSVGWLGAAVAFLSLALVAVQAQDPAIVRGLTIAMDVMGFAILVPLSLASFATGVVQALGTPWGLFRHYWVVVKLGLSVVATLVLLDYTSTLSLLGDAARTPSLSDDVMLPSMSPVVHAAGGSLVLMMAASLSIFKPRGLTPRGWRVQQRRVGAATVTTERCDPDAVLHGAADREP